MQKKLLQKFFSIAFLCATSIVQAQDFTSKEIVNLDKSSNISDYIRSIDYDNDGDLDILQAGGTNSRDLKIFINDGFGNFTVDVLASYSGSIDFEIGDLDNDGDEDILVYSSNRGFYVLENLTGSFSESIVLDISISTIRLADIVDIDGDGLNDIVYAVFNPDNIVWVKNEGDFIFSANDVLIPESNYNGFRINYFEIVDIDNDADLDAFVITDGFGITDNVYMTINDGADTTTTTLDAGQYTFQDFNGDDFIDFAVVKRNISGTVPGEVNVHLNDQSNSFIFSSLKTYEVNGAGNVPVIAETISNIDYDNDGDFDLVVGENVVSTAGRSRLFINEGNGSFIENGNVLSGGVMTSTQTGTGIYISQVHRGDYNGDNLNDVLIFSGGDGDMILHTLESEGSFSANYINYYMERLTRIQYEDVNTDGFKDFILIDQTANGKVLINYNDGNQNFQLQEEVVFDNISNGAKDVLLGDWNGNSDIDLFYASQKRVYLVNDFFNPSVSDTTLIYTSDPDGTGDPRRGFLGVTNNESNVLQLIDIDNDGDLDLFVLDNLSNENKISWLENTGGSFTLHQMTIDLDSYELIDLNNDDHPDIVYTKRVGNSEHYVRVAFFNPTTSLWEFQAEENTENIGPQNFAMADVDVDGDKDIIFRGRWMENLGSGGFAEDLVYSGGIGSTGNLVSADINADGREDLISVIGDIQDPTYIDVFINEGENNFTQLQLGANFDFEGTGNSMMPLFIEDIDEDGRLDITSSFSGFGGGIVPFWFRTCFNSSSSITESACGQYTAPSGALFTESGVFEDIIPNSIGCDSVITIDLTILPLFEETAEATFCAGDIYEFGSQSLTTAGEYTEIFQSQAGCDSTVVLTLSEIIVYNETSESTICAGQQFIFGSQNLTDAGEFTEVFQSSLGCDSTVVLTLNVNPIFNETTTAAICAGESFIFGSQTLTTPGDFTEVLQSQDGCDSTVFLSLTVNPTFSVDTTVRVASNETYLFDGISLQNSGTYSANLLTTNSCDSIVNLNLQVNGLPTVPNYTFEVAENSPEVTLVGIIEATDPDNDPLSYSITAGNTNNAFAVNANNGELSVANALQLDYETNPTLTLDLQVSDGLESVTSVITINLTDVDENTAPTIVDQTFSIDENSANGTSLGSVIANDAEQDALIYSITAGNTNDAFALNGNNGELSVADVAQLDFETTPTFILTVQVSDGSLSASASVSINLIDVDENTAPIIADQTFSIDENSANGTSLGSVMASDPEQDALTYSITSGNTNGAFAVNSSNGELSVADVAQLDFETTPTFTLTVEVSDGSLSASASVTINLIDVDENTAPTIADQTFSIDENSANGTSLGSVMANDPEQDALIYSITSGNTNDAFALNRNIGELSVADVAQLDFETTPTFTLTVEVSDGSLSASASVTINLIDVDENTSPAIADQTFSIDENSANGTSLGSVMASDPEQDALTYSITAGNTNDAFAVNSSNGELSVADAAQLDFETTPTFTLTIEVSDTEFTATGTIVINLIDLDENVLGIQDQQGANVKLYPNPIQNFLKVEWDKFERAVISELSGQEVLISDSRSVDLSNFKAGMYIITVIGTNQERVIFRIIKE